MARKENGATIQAVGPQNIAQATLGLKGGDVPQNILVPDLLGTIELGRRSELELLFQQDIVPFSISVDVNPVAAQNGYLDIQPAIGDAAVPWLTVITDVQGLNAIAGKLIAYYQTVVLGGAFTSWFSRDTRFGYRLQALDRLPLFAYGTAGLAGAAPPALWRSSTLTSSIPTPFPGVVMRSAGPGNEHLIIANDTVNLPFAVNVSGYSVPVKST